MFFSLFSQRVLLSLLLSLFGQGFSRSTLFVMMMKQGTTFFSMSKERIPIKTEKLRKLKRRYVSAVIDWHVSVRGASTVSSCSSERCKSWVARWAFHSVRQELHITVQHKTKLLKMWLLFIMVERYIVDEHLIFWPMMRYWSQHLDYFTASLHQVMR